MIGAYCRDRIVWLKFAGEDQWGTPSAPIEVPTKCRVHWETRLVKNDKGEEVLASGYVLMKLRPTHKDAFRIDGVEHIILKICDEKDWKTKFFKVYFQ